MIENNHRNKEKGSYLGGFGFAGACGAGRGCAKLDVQCAGDGHPAAVGQIGDDEPRGGAHVLVAVVEYGVDLLDEDVVDLVVPVVPELLQPVEVLDGLHVFSDEFVNDVAAVDV